MIDIFTGKATMSNSLKLGQVVSYGDMANPRQEAVIVETHGNQYGQRCVFREDHHESQVSMTQIEGLGGWKLVDEIANTEEIEELKQKRTEKLGTQRLEQELREQQCQARIELGKAIFTEKRPDWAKAVIVAEYEVDNCDLQTDYFNTVTKKVLILAWSKHTRDIFSEMRKAAKNAPETEHLAISPDVNQNGEKRTEENKEWWHPSDEHREKYSMGAGYYLKASGRYSTGWKVEKWPLPLSGSFWMDKLYEIAGTNSCFRISDNK